MHVMLPELLPTRDPLRPLLLARSTSSENLLDTSDFAEVALAGGDLLVGPRADADVRSDPGGAHGVHGSVAVTDRLGDGRPGTLEVGAVAWKGGKNEVIMPLAEGGRRRRREGELLNQK